MIDIPMPQLGESVTEGTIVSWRKRTGDAVAHDELLCEVATDKVTFEVPSPGAGTLFEIVVGENETALVGNIIGRIEPAGDTSFPESISSVPNPADPLNGGLSGAPESRLDATYEKTKRQRLSPVVRRLAREGAIDLTTVQGTGADGRITRNDVRAAIDARQTERTGGPASNTAAALCDDPVGALMFDFDMLPGRTSVRETVQAGEKRFPVLPMDGDRAIPFSPIRRRTAEHMSHSVATSPHGFISFEVNYQAVERVRIAHTASFKKQTGVSLTYLPFVLRALAEAVKTFPLINSAVDGHQLIVRRDLNVGIAVDLCHEGLTVPVLRGVSNLRLCGLALAVANLAQRARARNLGTEDLSGATFTVTNPGPIGTYLSIPIINQPQAAILVTDGVRKTVDVAQRDGEDMIIIRPKGFIGLSMDHRAFDGAYAADFLKTLKGHLEERDWEAEI